MKVFKLKRTTLALFGVAFVAIGTYNSVVVNSDAFMDSQSVRFVKRLDELNGEFTAGRKLANNGEWIKLRSPVKKLKSPIIQDRLSYTASASTETVKAEESVDQAAAAIKEELSLELVEVFNAKKYANPPKAGEFGGSLSANNGTIESISVNLPNNESLSIGVSELAGNVFEYELDGQVLSGMMYQMDKTSYMVTLTNGPYEGTRLKFSAPAVQEENFGNNAEAIANNETEIQAEEAAQPVEFAPVVNDDGTQSEVGQFGAQPVAAPEQLDVAQNEVPAPEGGYGFNFENSSTTF